MAYALVASLPPVYGLYISFFPSVFYAFLGTCPHLAIGSYALVSLLTGVAVNTAVDDFRSSVNITSTNSTDLKNEIDKFSVSVAVSLALLVGLIQVGY